ncbi:hypothetical protein PYCC9005_002850 [Savitreella phatthalungensis]
MFFQLPADGETEFVHVPLVLKHPRIIVWEIYLLAGVCSVIVVLHAGLKLYRRLWTWGQQGWLLVGWAGSMAMAGVAGWSFVRHGTDLTRFLLICSYISTASSHAIKMSIALLYMSFGRIRAYRYVNPGLLAAIAISFAASIVALPLACPATTSDRCRFDRFAIVQCTANALLGVLLAMYPLKPLYEARKVVPAYNLALLGLLFSTGIAEAGVSVARAVVYGRTMQDDDVDAVRRLRKLCFWLMLETCLSVVLATAPDFGGYFLHLHNVRRHRRGLEHAAIKRFNPQPSSGALPHVPRTPTANRATALGSATAQSYR